MTMRINFNSSAVRAHSSLAQNDRLMQLILARLSSGERIARSGDDPAGMALADGLRYHRVGIDRAVGNGEEGVTMLQTAEGGMEGISALLTRMRTLALNAANSGNHDAASLAALQTELDTAIASVTRIADSTRYAGKPLLQGAMADISLGADAARRYRGASADATRLPGGIATASTLTIAPPSLGTLSRDRVQASVTAGTPGSTAIAGLDFGAGALDDVAGKAVTISGPLGSASITLASTTTLDQFVSLANALNARTGATAAYDAASGALTVASDGFGSGALALRSERMSTATTIGLLDSDTTGPANALEPARDTFAMSLQTIASAVPSANAPVAGLRDGAAGAVFDSVDGRTLTVYGAGSAATLTMTASTTIQQVVDFVNAGTATTGARADYDSATGALRIVGARGPVRLSAQPMTTAGTTGLLDRDTTSIAATGGTQVAASANATIAVAFTDGAGTGRTVTLTQQPGGDGLSFTNLTPGPEATAPYTGWQAGAFSVRLIDTSAGTFLSTLASPTASVVATRTSTTYLQLGGTAEDGVNVELADLRAGALGRSAGLAAAGMPSLLALTDLKALSAGRAQEAISVIDAAIADVGAARGSLGALQAANVEAAIDSLRVSSVNLLDAESRIRDTDFALESVAYARSNIMLQSATAMLAQANQVPQTVLQLLR